MSRALREQARRVSVILQQGFPVHSHPHGEMVHASNWGAWTGAGCHQASSLWRECLAGNLAFCPARNLQFVFRTQQVYIKGVLF